jgi:hypothetical protein
LQRALAATQAVGRAAALAPGLGAPVEMRLVVWFEHGSAWRARMGGA